MYLSRLQSIQNFCTEIVVNIAGLRLVDNNTTLIYVVPDRNTKNHAKI